MGITLPVVILGLASLLVAADPRPVEHPWQKEAADPSDSIIGRFKPPDGFDRVDAKPGSMGNWLRHLPLKPGTPPVLLFDGSKKKNQDAHAAVVDIDVGNRDLQQCADAVLRLRAEYLWSINRPDDAAFHFTSGDLAEFKKWAAGLRPVVNGNKVSWKQSAAPDRSYQSFRKFMDVVFVYAGSLSLSKELKPVDPDDPIEIGNIFIRGGSPGHAVIVVDVANNPKTGRRVFIIAQSYMPAQQIHVLKNLAIAGMSPWYDDKFGEELKTPEWTFKRDERMRF